MFRDELSLHQDGVRQIIELLVEQQVTSESLIGQLSFLFRPKIDDPYLLTLPYWTARAVSVDGRVPESVTAITAAWQLLSLAAKLFDDVEDGDYSANFASGVNLGTAVLFLSRLALAKAVESGLPASVYFELCSSFDQACLRSSSGQSEDIERRFSFFTPDPEVWRRVADLKSGALFGWAAWAGALAAGARPEACASAKEFGRNVGILVQIADDYNGVWGKNGAEDLRARQFNLATCYAWLVSSADQQARLNQLILSSSKGDRIAEASAIELMTNLGARNYFYTVGLLYRDLAQEKLAEFERQPLDLSLKWLLNLIMPVLSRIEEGIRSHDASQSQAGGAL